MRDTFGHKFASVVVSIGELDEGPNAPVDVSFQYEAAVFSLERNHPCFQSWIELLKKSLETHSTVVFTARGAGRPRLESVERADKISGVVERIEKVEGDEVGFKIPHYVHMFTFPAHHPQREDWVNILRKSNEQNVKIVFAYDAYNRRVTSLAFAEE